MSAREEGASALALPEIERRVANMIRFGHITAVDHTKKRVRVESGELKSAWLRWSAGRAGAGKRRWDPPEVGEQVAMLAPTGDLRQAMVIPGFYQDDYDSPSDDPAVDLTEYGDGTKISYNRETHELLADLGDTKVRATREELLLQIGGVKLTMTSAGGVFDGPFTVNGPFSYTQGMAGSGGSGTSITGDFAADGGTFKHNDKNVGSDHKHSGVQSGGSNTNDPI